MDNTQLKNTAMMSPELIKRFKLFQSAMVVAKLPFILTSVARTLKEQTALYAQGRNSIDQVNLLRKIAGLTPITKEQNVCVTWTMKSKHIVDPDSKDPTKHLSNAFDIAIIKPNNQPTWDIKVDVNNDMIPDYQEAGKLGQSVGLIWGGTFKSSPDYPHYQYGV